MPLADASGCHSTARFSTLNKFTASERRGNFVNRDHDETQGNYDWASAHGVRQNPNKLAARRARDTRNGVRTLTSRTTKRKFINQFLCGDALSIAQSLPAESVDTIVTSPPYFQQRDYGSKLQIGQETSPAAYVERMAELFVELKRVVKPTGSVWMVIGDKYVNGELLGMPWRVCFALKDAGWILRSDCIWHKPNAMPSSVKTRPTTDHEYIFIFQQFERLLLRCRRDSRAACHVFRKIQNERWSTPFWQTRRDA